MPCILQICFPFAGPWGDALTEAMTDLAHSISGEPGLLWKIWTEHSERREAGGIYLFADADSAQTYLSKHSKRLQAAGCAGIDARIFDVNLALSQLNRAPL